MKRKIFSKLLMVALVIAAVGSFVSCKDYDDDINNLQKQIDAKAAISELTALQSTLEGKISTATAAAQKAAEDAAAKADASLKSTLEAAIADAKKAGTDAGTEAGKAIAAANAAQTTADAAAAAAKKADEDAKAALADALKTIGETYQTKADAEAALKTIAESYATKAEAEEIKAEVEGLKDELEKAIDEKIDAKIQEVNNAVASVDALWAAITGIELVNSWSKYAAPGATYGVYNLNMLHGEQVTGVFGNEAYSDADELITYAAGDSLKFNNRIIVRVNPANATLAKEDIHLINSKGESLDDLIEVSDVKDFTGLITTRGDYATGLKQISFVRKAGEATTDAAFGEATSGVKTVATGKTATGQALFAVSVNNTKSDAADRFVSTTFDVTISYGWFVPATEFAFTVKGDGEEAEATPIAQLRNRWSAAEKKTIGEDQTKELPSDKWPAELVWQNITGQTAPKAPAAEYTLPAWDKLGDKTANVNSGDARYGINFKYIEIEKGGHFTVSGLNTNKIDYYYVALDKDHAVESAPSEWESWNSYSYEGLLEMTPSTEDKVITVKSDAAEGDIIGFRVYAVNYDGTLADPDGMAFYVKVGEPKAIKAQTATARFVANVATTTGTFVAADAYKLFLKGAVGAQNFKVISASAAGIDPAKFQKLTLAPGDAQGAITIAKTAKQSVAAVKGYYALLQTYDEEDASKMKLADNWQNINYIAFAAEKAGDIVDATTIEGVKELIGKDPDHHNEIVNTLKINVYKEMPVAAPGFTWRSDLNISGSTLKLMMQPNKAGTGTVGENTAANIDYTAKADWGVKNIRNLFNTTGDVNYFRFTFATASVRQQKVDDGDVSLQMTSTGFKTVKGDNATAEEYTYAGQGIEPWNLFLAADGNTNANFGFGGLAAGVKTLMDGKTESALKVEYKYPNVSLHYGKFKSAGTEIEDFYVDYNATTKAGIKVTASGNGEDYWANVNTGVNKVVYTYATYGQTYRWANYQYVTAWNTDFATSTKASDNVYLLDYSDIGASTTTTSGYNNGIMPAKVADPSAGAIDNANWGKGYNYTNADKAIFGADWSIATTNPVVATAKQVSTDFSKLVIVENSNYAPANNKPLANLFGIIAPAAANVTIVGTSTTANENIAVNAVAGTTVTFAQALAVEGSYSAKLTFKGKDCFNQDVKVELPITVQP